jgi:hypothetical protein
MPLEKLASKQSRRKFLAHATSLAGASLASCAMPHMAMGNPADTGDSPASPLVKRVVRSPKNTYFTYPHSNGFLPDGSAVFASPTGGSGRTIDFIAFDPNKPNEDRRLASVNQARTYYAISANGLMVFSGTDGSASVLDLTSSGSGPHKIFHQDDLVISGDNDISIDGKSILLTGTQYDPNKKPIDGKLMIVDIATGAITNVVNHWEVDHAHFSPYDQRWVCFADNRANNTDRMWVWNQEQAPKGRHIFNQNMPGGHYTVGHERAMFNKPALLTIAYTFDTDPGSPTPDRSGGHPGLYEVGFDGSIRLISASKRDFHCNISRDGSWAVVSLRGTYDPSDSKPSGDWLKTLGTGYGYSDVMVVNMRTGARQFFYRGTNATDGQPYEVQPSISPDGRWVLLKDARERRVLMVEVNQVALRSFLSA